MLSSGLITGVCSSNANVSEHSVCSIFILVYEAGTDTIKVWNQEFLKWVNQTASVDVRCVLGCISSPFSTLTAILWLHPFNFSKLPQIVCNYWVRFLMIHVHMCVCVCETGLQLLLHQGTTQNTKLKYNINIYNAVIHKCIYLLDYIRLWIQLHVSAQFVGPSAGWSLNRWGVQLIMLSIYEISYYKIG
jgi:hypothetical protein